MPTTPRINTELKVHVLQNEDGWTVTALTMSANGKQLGDALDNLVVLLYRRRDHLTAAGGFLNEEGVYALRDLRSLLGT